ncbi:MAG TPA: efflux transporter outer membrane subunit, partial [Burkholderiaceae bacterium]|nr:efflux transporter outer membrane subunit [Burkholderiaceae bacterium]
MHRAPLLVTCLAIGLAGCVVGPDYHRPAVDVPSAWRVSTEEAAQITDVTWWDRFGDPVLSRLVRTALENNQDLAIASANVDQAFAQYGITRSALFPQVDAGASLTRQGLSQNTSPFHVPPGLQAFNDLRLNISASYELDLWGKLRRATEAARAGLLASEEGRRTVVLTVVATVASSYVQLLALDRQLDIAKHTSESLGEAARLQQVRFEGGATPESDYRQAQSQYEVAAAQVPELERQIGRQENLLSFLLGTNPGPIPRTNSIAKLKFPDVPQGLPSSLLERRPDILQAEQNLIAANANIGVAKAAYFPQIELTALLGMESARFSDLFKGPSKAWSYAGDATQPIFNAGRIRSQVEQARAAQRQALYSYQRTIISAFEDFDDALLDRVKFEQARTEQVKNVAALQRFRNLAVLRYQEGATIYLEVANAEQSLFNAELQLVSTQSQVFQSYVNLYRAMAGGWLDTADSLSARPAAP